MSEIIVQNYKTSLGELLIGVVDKQLCLLDWRYRRMRKAVDARLQKYFECQYTEGTDPLVEETKAQIDSFLAGSRKTFDLPIAFAGTDFQKRVWEYLITIPYGETRSYGQMAEDLGDIKAVRAVASANGANSMSLIVPCHRIIESNGGLGGYAGGLPAKKKLLELESGQADRQLELL